MHKYMLRGLLNNRHAALPLLALLVFIFQFCRDEDSGNPSSPVAIALNTISGAGITLDGKCAYFQTEDRTNPGRLYRVQTETNNLDTYESGGCVFGVPTITSGYIVTSSVAHGIKVLDKSNMSLRWERSGFNWVPVVTSDEEKVYVTELDKIRAFSIVDGTQLWESTIFGKNTFNPVVEDDRLYFATGSILNKDGYAYCFNKNNGTLIFQDTLRYVASKNQFGGSAGGVYVWGEFLFVPSDNWSLYCFDKTNGSFIWEFTADAPLQTPPSVSGNKVYFGSLNRTCYAVDIFTGNLVWSYRTTGSIARVTPSFHNANVLFVSFGALIILNKEEGTLLVEYNSATSSYSVHSGIFGNEGQLLFTARENGSNQPVFVIIH